MMHQYISFLAYQLYLLQLLHCPCFGSQCFGGESYTSTYLQQTLERPVVMRMHAWSRLGAGSPAGWQLG